MQKKQQKKQDSELKAAIFKLKKYFIFVGVFSFFINLLMLVPPLYMLQLYDRVVTSRSEGTLFLLTGIVVILFITMALLEIVRSKVLIRIGNKIDEHISTRLFDSIFALSNKQPMKASSQPLSDLTQVRQFMTGNGVFAFFDAPWLPIYIFILFMFHPYMGYFAIFAALVLVAITITNELNTKEPLKKANVDNRKATLFVDVNVRNSEVVHAMGMLDDIRKNWRDKHHTFLNSQTIASENASVWSNVTKTSRMMFQSLMLGLGAYLAITGKMTPGMMIAGSIIMGRALAPLDLIVNTWKQFSGARVSFARIDALLHDFPVSKENMDLPDPTGEVTLESIAVVPPNAKQPSLVGVSMHIDKGEIVGVIGPSAAGKSSFARALLGVWPLVQGKVRYDKADITHYNRTKLGKFIGYLPQDVEIFEGTVAKNIARFSEVDSNKVIKAAKLAGVHEMILKLPNGYDTVISSATLSGGQKQRIGLARALYGDPVLVVLDEPNSNLDEVGEAALLKALITLKEAGTTVILITHKQNVLMATTKLALFRDGKLQMYGDTKEVLAKLSQATAQQQQAQQQAQAQRQQTQQQPQQTVHLSKPGA